MRTNPLQSKYKKVLYHILKKAGKTKMKNGKFDIKITQNMKNLAAKAAKMPKKTKNVVPNSIK